MPSLVVLCSADFEPLSLCRKFSISQSRNSASLLSQSLSLRVDSPTQVCFNATPFGFQLIDHDSSSSQSSQSNNRDLIATPGINSHDQCHEISEGDIIGQIKPIYSTSHHITADIDYSPTMTFMPYSCGDLYFNGLLSAFAPIMGITTTRVPLPLDILQDEPIYVNVKQYNGILRRRHSRAKLHAQNKLIKARKPYLHESRHRHAVNRVRGSGGRFLSTKKPPQSDTTSTDHHSNNARKLSISNPFY